MRRDDALAKLNDLVHELQQRRMQLAGGSEAIRQQMEKIQDIPSGPADDLAKALSQSNFQKGAEALARLQQKLAGAEIDPAAKEALARQFQQLEEKIARMAAQAGDAQADLRRRADRMKRSTDAADAGMLEDAIRKLQEQAPQMESLRRLAEAIGQCSRQAQPGQGSQSADAVEAALRQLRELARQQSELQTLDEALGQLADARRQINGQPLTDSPAISAVDTQSKVGVGQESGNGVRQEDKLHGKFFDVRVPQTIGKGASHIVGLAGGPNLKEQAEAEIAETAARIERGSADPLSGQRLPKKQSEHVRQYFDSFREGK